MDTYDERVALLQEQLAGIAAWRRTYAARETAELAIQGTREVRLDSARRMDALRRAHHAAMERAGASIEDSLAVLDRPERTVVVHRSSFVRQRLTASLTALGLSVIAELDNGADGLGVTVAEQPDLLIVEDRLPSMTGLELVRAARSVSPRTLVAAQASDDASVADLLDAGVIAVFSRTVAPAALVEQVVSRLRRAEPPLLV